MAIQVQCPQCKAVFPVTAADASRPLVCRACGHVVRSPRPDPQGEYSLVQKKDKETAANVDVVEGINWRGWAGLAAVLLLLLTALAATLAYRFAVLRAGK